MPITERGRKFLSTVHHKGERYRRSFDARADAETWEMQARLDLRNGRPVDLGDTRTGVSTGVTMERLREEALAHHWSSNKDTKGPALNTRLVCDMLGWDLPVTQVSSRRIEDMVIKLVQLGNSDSTINRKMSALSTMLQYARKHQYIPSVPDIPRRREPENRIRWISEDEEGELLAFFKFTDNQDMIDFIKVGLDTGARRGELLKMQSRDIHEGKLYIWESKGGKPRSIPLTNRANEVLSKRMSLTDSPTEKLFASLSGDALRYYWDRARQHMKLMLDAQFVPHIMRHTFCSRLAMKGVPLPVIKELAGHATIMTTQRYVHMAPSNLTDAIHILEGNNYNGSQSSDQATSQNCGVNGVVA